MTLIQVGRVENRGWSVAGYGLDYGSTTGVMAEVSLSGRGDTGSYSSGQAVPLRVIRGLTERRAATATGYQGGWSHGGGVAALAAVSTGWHLCRGCGSGWVGTGEDGRYLVRSWFGHCAEAPGDSEGVVGVATDGDWAAGGG